MSITTFGIFQKKGLTFSEYLNITNELTQSLAVLTQQLRTVSLTSEKVSVKNRRNAVDGPNAVILDAIAELNLIAEQLKMPPANVDAHGRNLTDAQMKKCYADSLESNMQNIVDVYNGLVRHPQFTPVVRNVFADFFTKMMDIITEKLGGRVKGGAWRQSKAQTTLEAQFNNVYTNIVNARQIALGTKKGRVAAEEMQPWQFQAETEDFYSAFDARKRTIM